MEYFSHIYKFAVLEADGEGKENQPVVSPDTYFSCGHLHGHDSAS